MKILRYTIFALIALFAVSCATSKSFYKKGKKLEEAGMLEEAASMYMTSLQKNSSNIDARIGMKASGQIVMNKLLQEFIQLKQFGEKKQAVKAYESAVSYHQKVQLLGVELQFPDFYKADFRQLKEEYTIELYQVGLDLMDQGKYAAAEANFKEIARLDPEHSDASDLANIAYAEPLYKKAVKAYDLMEYRRAYENFKLVVDRIPSYKEASQLKAAALENGLFTIAMLPFENATSSAGLEAKVEAYSLEALISVNDPFLKVVDRANMELILEEQKLGLTGIIDDETAVTVGELIGAQAIMTGTVLSYSKATGQVNTAQREAYVQYKVKRYDKEQEKYFYDTKYKKTSYTELQRENRVILSFQYKIISLKTGEILLTKIVEKIETDRVVWGEFGGDLSKLYPARGNGVSLNSRARTGLREIMAASQTPKSTEALTNDAFVDVSLEMKNQVSRKIKELVK